MDRIGGFSGGEIRELTAFIEKGKNGGRALTALFKAFGEKHKRSAGSVRNFYYQLCAIAERDETLYDKYFNGVRPDVGKIKPFDDSETEKLMKGILDGKLHNRSVRRTLIELGGGDEKVILRYQNKFRNIIKTNPDALYQLAEEGGEFSTYEEERLRRLKNDRTKMSGLRVEINGLVERLSSKNKTDNAALKKRVCELEEENRFLLTKLSAISENYAELPKAINLMDNSQHAIHQSSPNN